MKLAVCLLMLAAALVGALWWVCQPHGHVLSEHMVQFARLQHGTLRDVVSATGRLEPRQVITLSCSVPGTIVFIADKAKINNIVDEGEVLARFDQDRANLDLEEAVNGVNAAATYVSQAEGLKKAAQLELKYQLDLEKKGGFRSEKEQAEVKLDAARAGVKVAEARLEAARIALKKASDALARTEIKVPAAAGGSRTYCILERKLELGQFVGPGPALFLLTPDLELMEIHAQVAEGDVAKVAPKLKITFTVQAYSDEDVVFHGTVREIRPMAVQNKGAVFYDTVIDVDKNKRDAVSKEWQLRPGMTASVDIIRREHADVWKIPTEAINFHLDKAYWSESARKRVEEWQAQHKDAGDWHTIWTWAHGGPWPTFVRLGGVRKDGEPGLKDGDFVEILEFEAGHEPSRQDPPRIIIEAPPARAPGLFEQPWNLKVS